MKQIANKIKTEWMSKVRLAQIKSGDNAPLEINNKPTLIHRDCDMRYYHMSLEELNERRQAIQSHDLTDKQRLTLISDALGDEFYLWIQSVISHGLLDKIEDIILEIHKSNLSKLQDEDIIMDENCKIQKPSSYFKPDLHNILFK